MPCPPARPAPLDPACMRACVLLLHVLMPVGVCVHAGVAFKETLCYRKWGECRAWGRGWLGSGEEGERCGKVGGLMGWR